jgi:hypothetical protein
VHSPLREANSFSASQDISPYYVEPEGLRPYSYESAAGRYSESNESNPLNPL